MARRVPTGAEPNVVHFTAASLAALSVKQLTELKLHTCGLDDGLLRAPALDVLRISKNAISMLMPFAGGRLRELHLWQVPLAAAEVPCILEMTGIEMLHISNCPDIENPIAAATT